MSYQYPYPEQDHTKQVPAFGSQLYWADDGEEDVDYSAEALDSYRQPSAASEYSSPTPHQHHHQKESSSRSSKPSRHHHKRKESKTSSSYPSGSDTERESSSRSGKDKDKGKMSGGRTAKHQHSVSSSRRAEKSSSKPSSVSSSRRSTDDWSEVTDPEERRRIQNKIAQRKFREKNKLRKEEEQRDLLNQQNAKYIYEVPSPQDLPSDAGDLSGLPWGGPNMGVIMARGHATSASQMSSGRQPSQSSDPSTTASATVMDTNYLSPYTGGYAQMGHGSWGGGSSGDASSSYGYPQPPPQHQHYPGSYYAGGGGGGGGGGSSGEDNGSHSPLSWNYNAEYNDYEGHGGAESSGGYHIA
ncbi:hypothetical protein V8F20_006767 [Naviculisporaceae sp. PSN 640]